MRELINFILKGGDEKNNWIIEYNAIWTKSQEKYSFYFNKMS